LKRLSKIFVKEKIIIVVDDEDRENEGDFWLLLKSDTRNDQFHGYTVEDLCSTDRKPMQRLGLHVMVSNTDPMNYIYGFGI
jgi:3,4-dihydroxy-2-butanone 4-phosphate synthase